MLDNTLWGGWVRGTAMEVTLLSERQNCRPFPDNIFKCIFLNDNV